MKKTYWRMEAKNNLGFKHLPMGFSIGAAVFGLFWAMWRGSLLLFVAFSAGTVVLYLLPQWVASPYSPGLSLAVTVACNISAIVALGMYSNIWYRKTLELDGWKLVGVTTLKTPQPPDSFGEWLVREYGVIDWPANEPPEASTVAGYLLAQHEREPTSWLLTLAGPSWAVLDETLFESPQEAKALVEEQHPALQGKWRVLK